MSLLHPAPSSAQAVRAVVMIRPSRFRPNPDTAGDNAFQAQDASRSPERIAADAYAEVTAVATGLRELGVEVHLFEDESGRGADSVFPNNWFSTHAGGHVAIYPMYSPSRRGERRTDVVELLKERYRVQDVIDYSGLERDEVYLEGTGAMVLDHVERVAYAARSNRTNDVALERFCTHFGFEPMLFDAVDPEGRQIYHTNVLMGIGTSFAMAGLSLLPDPRRREQVRERLSEHRALVELTPEQIADFAGNAIELRARDGLVLAMSSRARASLRPDQVEVIESYAQIADFGVPTIELAGGSIRCMLAGIHLARRATPAPDAGQAAAEAEPPALPSALADEPDPSVRSRGLG